MAIVKSELIKQLKKSYPNFLTRDLSKLIHIILKVQFNLFIIHRLHNLYNILNNHQLEIGNIEQYYYFKNRRWDLVFSNDLVVKLPSKNKSDSIKIYKQLMDNDNLINTKIIDLRVTNQIIMTNKNE